MIHRNSCTQVKRPGEGSHRLLEIEWNAPSVHLMFKVRLRLLAKEQPGMIVAVSQVIAETGTNIFQLNAASNPSQTVGMIEVVVQIYNPRQLKKLTDGLMNIEDMVSVERL